jgi:hypothetical protein
LLEQISTEVADAEEPNSAVHNAMGLDIEEPDASELDSMEPDKEPNPMESDTGPEVLCRDLLVWGLLS